MHGHDTTLPPVLARCVRNPLYDDEDDMLPCVGERFRDITHDIHCAAIEAQQDQQDIPA